MKEKERERERERGIIQNGFISLPGLAVVHGNIANLGADVINSLGFIPE